LYVRALLGISVKDATAGFRLFRRSTLDKIDLDQVKSTGYVFQSDLVYRTLRAGLTVREVPIEFVERVRGDSKMTSDVAKESLKRITWWGLTERRDRVRRAVRRHRGGQPGPQR
ncbi:MAG: dolichol-phosphate mannosyltransferase, partial [Nocardioides sp.]